jgi:exosortase
MATNDALETHASAVSDPGVKRTDAGVPADASSESPTKAKLKLPTLSQCVPGIVLILVIAVAFAPLFRYFWHRWWEEDHAPFGYGYFIPPTCLYLLWCRRDKLAAAKVEPAPWWAWGILGLTVFVLLLGIRASVTVVESLAFASALVVVPYCIWGKNVLKHSWGALLYGWTMIPWPGQATGGLLIRMQQLSTDQASWVFNHLGISSLIDGTTVWLPNFNFEVAVACAGLTILFPTLSIAILTAMMVKAKMWQKLLLIVVSIPISIIANTLRIVLIGYIGNSGGKDLAEKLHDASGIVGVILASFVLYFVGLLIGCGKYLPEYTPTFGQEEIAN